jgi:hypothetical protein
MGRFHTGAAKSLLAVLLALCCWLHGAAAANMRSRRVFAHYLPWYTAAGGDGWTYVDSVTGERRRQYVSAPVIGEYSQLNASVLEYHLLTAAVSGLDGFIVNWDPRSGAQTEIISDLFAAVARLPAVIQLDPSRPASAVSLKLFVSYDYQGTDYDPALLQGHFQQIKDLWAGSPDYFRDDAADSDGDDDGSGGGGGGGIETGGAAAGPLVIMLWNDGATAAYSAASAAVFGGAGNVTLLTRNAVFGNANESLSAGAFEWPTPQTAGAGYDPSDYGEACVFFFFSPACPPRTPAVHR